MKTFASLAVTLALLLLAVPRASSHCEIPCGIYGDQTRFALLAEHIDTIEKSMKQIQALSQQKNKNYNQLVRWIDAKEAHAKKIQYLVRQYFLTQRVKPVAPSDKAGYQKYVKQLVALHGMLVAAMKAKQTTDLANVEKLRDLLKEFRALYKSGR